MPGLHGGAGTLPARPPQKAAEGMSGHVSYWLTAAEPDGAHLSEVVRSLATQFDAPLFEPHVTLYSGLLHSNDKPDEIMRAATREISEIVLNATGIGRTEQFTKTL